MFDLAGVELEPKAEQFKTEIEQLKSEIIKRDRKIIELNDQISEMYQSRSWRWSSLIRIMGNLTRYIKEKTLRFFKKMVFLKEDLQLKINRNFTLKIVFISAYPGTPGHVYRVERYVQTYRDLGCFANWIPLDQLSFFRKDIITANIIIFWRVEDSIEIETLIKSAKNNNAIIIYDIDDYIFDPDIADENHLDQIRSIDNKAYQFKLFSKRINALVSIVDYCTGTTIPLVKGFQKFGKTAFLLPNGFDDKVQSQDILTKKKEDDCIKIGYAGGTLTHQRDFKEVVPALVKIFSEYGNVKLIVFKKVLLLNEFPELS